jgi:hypothetical protein
MNNVMKRDRLEEEQEEGAGELGRESATTNQIF